MTAWPQLGKTKTDSVRQMQASLSISSTPLTVTGKGHKYLVKTVHARLCTTFMNVFKQITKRYKPLSNTDHVLPGALLLSPSVNRWLITAAVCST